MTTPGLLAPGNPIPGPWGWFEILLLAVFTIHLLLMNGVVGGAIVAFFESMRRDNPLLGPFSARIPKTLALAVNFGVAPFLFLQLLYGRFIYVGATLSATYWLSAVGLVLLAYYGLYILAMGPAGARTAAAGLSALLLLATAFVFTNVMSLMADPGAWTAYFDRPDGTVLHLGDPSLAPRYLHIILAALAVGGLLLALTASARGRMEVPDAGAAEARGLKWFMGATLLQFSVGPWFLLSLPREVRLLFMGGSAMHTAALAAGVLGGLTSLLLAFRRMPRATLAAAVATVAVMAAARSLLRAALLAPYGSPADLPVVPQDGPALVFVASLGVAAVAIAAMLALAARAVRSPAPVSGPYATTDDGAAPAHATEAVPATAGEEA